MISIIIINYNVKKYLVECLHTILKSNTSIKFEIIIIDNNSDESIEEIEKEFNINNFRIYFLQNNLGFSKAVNYGIKKSNGSHILLLNPDTLISENTLQVLYDYIQQNDNIGICGCKVEYPDGTYQLSSKRSFPYFDTALLRILKFDKLFPNNKYFGKYNYTYLNEDEIASVDAISGSCMMFKKELIDNIGLFDGRYFLYFEDTDFCFRAVKNNYKVIYNPDTTIIHYKRESFKNSEYNLNYEFFKSLYYFYIKHYNEYKNFRIFKIFIKYILRFMLFVLKFFKI